MAHGERAEKNGHCTKEYWSARAGRRTSFPWGPIGKWITHRKERAAKRREEHKARSEARPE